MPILGELRSFQVFTIAPPPHFGSASTEKSVTTPLTTRLHRTDSVKLWCMAFYIPANIPAMKNILTQTHDLFFFNFDPPSFSSILTHQMNGSIKVLPLFCKWGREGWAKQAGLQLRRGLVNLAGLQPKWDSANLAGLLENSILNTQSAFSLSYFQLIEKISKFHTWIQDFVVNTSRHIMGIANGKGFGPCWANPWPYCNIHFSRS